MDKIKRMKELIHDLNRASDSYYGSGTTLMSDAEFDSKLLELKQLEEEANTVFPNSPVNRVGGAVLKSLIKVKHETPMLSLDKCHSVEEIKKFAAGHDIVASIKLDGISCRLIYQDGELIGAESRGNGTEGNDILQHCGCVSCNGSWAGSPTASGAYPVAGRTVAMADLPFGTEVEINGQIYTVEDRGVPSGCVDIYVDNHSEALNSGMYYAEVRVVG